MPNFFADPGNSHLFFFVSRKASKPGKIGNSIFVFALGGVLSRPASPPAIVADRKRNKLILLGLAQVAQVIHVKPYVCARVRSPRAIAIDMYDLCHLCDIERFQWIK